MNLRIMIYEGKLLPEYCKLNNISFKEIESRINRMRKNKKLDNYSNEELIDYIIKTFYKKRNNQCKYYVNDSTLGEYARKNGFTSFSMRCAVNSGLKKDPNASVSEIAKSFVERNKNRIKYTYDGYPLATVCKMHSFSNLTVLRIFHDNYPDMGSMTKEQIDTAIKEIVDALIENENNNHNVKKKGLRYEI